MKFHGVIAGLAGAYLFVSLAGAALADDDDGGSGKAVRVDCAAGKTIARALERGKDRRPLEIVVSGVCSENVVIDRDDVTLRADPPGSGGVNGPDATLDTVRITGARVTIDGLTVSGGRDGINTFGAAALVIRNVMAQHAGRSGIVLGFGSSAVIASSSATMNGRDGVVIDSASGMLISSNVSANTRAGVLIANNANGRIGIDRDLQVQGNTISSNGSNGVHISFASGATLAGNQITGNGTLANPLGRSGIAVFNADVSLVGGNNIANNTGVGINLRSSTFLSGDPSFGIPTTNTVSGNGDTASPGGMLVFLGSSALVRDMLFSANRGPGLALTLNSAVQLFNTVVVGNFTVGPGIALGDGIRLSFGSKMLVSSASSSTGNGNFGMTCLDGESSITNTGLLTLTGNFAGDFPNCSGF